MKGRNFPNFSAYLISVGNYESQGLPNLPEYDKNAKAVEEALVRELGVDREAITTVGTDGVVTRQDVGMMLINLLYGDCENLIIYFSGYGAKDGLLLSDGKRKVTELIEKLSMYPISKLWILCDTYREGSEAIDFYGVDKGEIEELAVISTPAYTEDVKAEGDCSIYTEIICKGLSSLRNGAETINHIEDAMSLEVNCWNIVNSAKSVNAHRLEFQKFTLKK